MIRNLFSSRRLRKYTLLLACIYLLGISAILRADFSYGDDLGRVLLGNRGWTQESRYVSELLSILMNANLRLSDLSPLPQMAACVILAISGILLLNLFIPEEKITLLRVLLLIPFGLNPYFLECLSYQFDSPFMACSILFSILPFSFRKDRRSFFLASVIFLLMMCMTYQASAGIYPMMVLFLILKRTGPEDAEKRSFLVTSLFAYALSLLVFRFIMRFQVSWYPTETISLSSLIPSLFSNLSRLYGQIRSDLNPIWKASILLIAAGWILGELRISAQKKNAGSVLFSLLILLACMVLWYGFYLVLNEPILKPRALYGFFVLLTLLAVTAEIPDWNPGALLLSWCCFLFAFTYGNALSAQKQYSRMKSSVLISTLEQNHLLSSDHVRGLQLSGSIGYSPVIRNMESHYPILAGLVPETLGGGWEWSEYEFSNYWNLPVYSYPYEQEGNADLSSWSEQDLATVSESSEFTIRANDSYILVIFH